MASGRIKSCVWTNEWKIPGTNDILQFHQVELENGDKGSIGKIEKYPLELAVGHMIEYKITGKKLELLEEGRSSASKGTGSAGKKGSYGGFGGGGKTVKHTDFLGYSMGYAKDMVIAGKTKPADIAAFKKVLKEIYEFSGTLLAESNAKTDAAKPAEVSDQKK